MNSIHTCLIITHTHTHCGTYRLQMVGVSLPLYNCIVTQGFPSMQTTQCSEYN